MELEALSETSDQFFKAGATLVLISPQLPEHNLAIAEDKKISFDILSDPGNEVAAQYGLRHKLPDDLKAIYQQFGLDVEKHNGDSTWTLPMPTMLIIDPDGYIQYAEINPDYTVRPDPQTVIEALHGI